MGTRKEDNSSKSNHSLRSSAWVLMASVITLMAFEGDSLAQAPAGVAPSDKEATVPADSTDQKTDQKKVEEDKKEEKVVPKEETKEGQKEEKKGDSSAPAAEGNSEKDSDKQKGEKKETTEEELKLPAEKRDGNKSKMTDPALEGKEGLANVDDGISTDSLNPVEIALVPQKVLILRGTAKWEEAYAQINKYFETLESEITKSGAKANGKRLALFTGTNETGFEFQAMIPVVDESLEKMKFGSDVAVGMSPGGKALKFQYRGPYEDIDAMYEAITVYTQEKELDAQSTFMEEYVAPTKNVDDKELIIDIYVFLK